MKKILFSLIISAAAPCMYAQTVPGVVAQYSFNNGNANDEIGLNNGVVHGATLTTDRFGNANKAYHFQGGTYITLPDAAVLKSQSMTVSLWVKLDSFSNSSPSEQNFIYSIINSTTSAYFGTFAMSVKTVPQKYFSVSQNDPSLSVSGYSANASTMGWQHYVLMVDNDSLKMYIDGQREWSYHKGFPLNYTSHEIFIGQSGNPTYFGYLNGNVDDIKVFDRVLTDTEVTTLHNEPNPATVGIGKVQTNIAAINIYPNPTTDNVFFGKTYHVILKDINGKILVENKASSLNLSAYPSGIYFISLTDNKGTILQNSKIVKR